eukprot:1153745-Pelagomonas_calceolata.AAC.2
MFTLQKGACSRVEQGPAGEAAAAGESGSAGEGGCPGLPELAGGDSEEEDMSTDETSAEDE